MAKTSVEVPHRLPAPEDRRRIRERAGISGTALAAQIGVAPASLYAWETSQREPKGLLREAYAQALTELAKLVDVEDEGVWPTAS